MMTPLIIICIFTFLIHITESLAYCMRLSGVRTRQIAIAMSFVTTTLLVSRLSNMFQSPLMGNMVDQAIFLGTPQAIHHLENSFRIIIFSGFLGSLFGAFLAPTAVQVFALGIRQFKNNASIPKIVLSAFRPSVLVKWGTVFKWPSFSMLSSISLSRLPKTFLILNIGVTSIYTIGVLCSLLAGAIMPDLTATAIQLSGIVNGLATIMLTLFVDPSGARITDEAMHNDRPESDVRSVVFFLIFGRLIGTLVIAQLLFKPFTSYIMLVTKWISGI